MTSGGNSFDDFRKLYKPEKSLSLMLFLWLVASVNNRSDAL